MALLFQSLNLFLFLLSLARPVHAGDAVVERLVEDHALSHALYKFQEVQAALAKVERVKRISDKDCLHYDFDWPDYKTGIRQLHKGDVVNSDTIFFVTHATYIFDRKYAIKNTVNQRVKEMLERGNPVIYVLETLDDIAKQHFYYLDYKPTYTYESNSGAHKLKLKAKQVVFAGGYFELCAGETVRDAILGWDPAVRPIRVIYLTDSLYTWPYKNLQKELQELDDQQMLDFLNAKYFSKNEIGYQREWIRSPPGTKEPFYKDSPASLKDYKITILRDGRKIGSLGTGSTEVEMNYIVNGPTPDFSQY